MYGSAERKTFLRVYEYFILVFLIELRINTSRLADKYSTVLCCRTRTKVRVWGIVLDNKWIIRHWQQVLIAVIITGNVRVAGKVRWISSLQKESIPQKFSSGFILCSTLTVSSKTSYHVVVQYCRYLFAAEATYVHPLTTDSTIYIVKLYRTSHLTSLWKTVRDFATRKTFATTLQLNDKVDWTRNSQG